MQVYICTDLEGITGVTTFEQTRTSGTPRNDEARRLLMGDINAAVEGCLVGGATRVVVNDGHGGGFNFIPELMHPGAEWFTGVARPGPACVLDESFDCALLVGYHAMNRVPEGVLCHTQSSLYDSRYWYNDIECGEIAQSALIMGHFGVPVVMVTGDTAATCEAHEFLGKDIVTVAVKEGFSRQCCRMLPPEKTKTMIRKGAKKAMGRIGKMKPYTMLMPLHGRMERLVEPMAEGTWEQMDAAERVVKEKVFTSALDIYTFD